ncbi:C4-type zinc ribbon domain-containing protein [Brevibacillus ginsengisoli]|uniref:C4-type zinc ribbon domain-containing protein n=1 Tax=Brevibacillus ginsengisoli TaxID=363854 RepID=UPI003CE7508F
MLPAKKLFEWHKVNETIAHANQELDELTKQEQVHVNTIQQLTSKLEALPVTDTPDDQIARMLAEQELWMAQKAYERFQEEAGGTRFELDSRISEQQFERVRLEQELEQAHLAEYYRIKENKKNPIVEVKRKMCTGCFLPLSLAKVDEWRRAKGLVYCDECGRILV